MWLLGLMPSLATRASEPMGVGSIQVKGVLQRSRLPDTSYVINPYRGCVHGCVYCYARFMKRFTGHSVAWGAFLDAKVNAPEVLSAELARRRKPLTGTVFLSSVTDPYQPPERQLRLTRRLLEILLGRQVPISILTKSDLVLRDIDLLERFDSCTVGLSIGILDEKMARRMEPRAPSPARRLLALRSLRDRGIRTYAFISPCLPVVTDLDQLMEALSGKVDEVGVEAINRRGGNWRGVEGVLGRQDPGLLKECEASSRDQGYWDRLEKRASQLAKLHGIRMTGFYRH